MHIAHRAYTAQREATSHSEASKKELPLKTKTTTTHRTETIKKMLSESGPESVLASKGRYSHTRTFAAGRDQRAVLAFSPENKRVEGFVINKDQQLVPIKPYDLPKELQQILNSDAFEAFLKDVHARLIQLHNGDFRLDLHQGLKGGVYRADGDVEYVKTYLENASNKAGGGRHESRVIIKNECSYSLSLIHKELLHGYVCPKQPAYVVNGNQISSGAASGIFVNSRFGVPFGSEGYLSLKAETQEGNLLIICSFSTAFHVMNDNSAKIIIRAMDDEGNVAGGGITPEGKITDMGQYFSQRAHHSGKPSNTKLFQCYSMLDVHCSFDNNTKAYFTFTFKEKEKEELKVCHDGLKLRQDGVDKKIDALFENEVFIMDKIDSSSKRLTEFEGKQKNMEEEMKNFSKKLTKIEAKQNDMEKDFNQKFLTNQEDIQNNQKNIAENQKDIKAVLSIFVPNKQS